MQGLQGFDEVVRAPFWPPAYPYLAKIVAAAAVECERADLGEGLFHAESAALAKPAAPAAAAAPPRADNNDEEEKEPEEVVDGAWCGGRRPVVL